MEGCNGSLLFPVRNQQKSSDDHDQGQDDHPTGKQQTFYWKRHVYHCRHVRTPGCSESPASPTPANACPLDASTTLTHSVRAQPATTNGSSPNRKNFTINVVFMMSTL